MTSSAIEKRSIAATLTTAQRAKVAAKLANIALGDNQYTEGAQNQAPSISQTAAAKTLKVSRSSVQRA